MSAIARRAVIAMLAGIAVIIPVTTGPAVALPSVAVPPSTPVPPGYRPFTIKTMPPIPGVRVRLNATQLVTGPDGTARTLMTKEDRDALAADRDAHLQMMSKNVNISPGVRGRFHGWYQEGYHFTPENPVGQVEIATFDVSSYTRFRFVDAHHHVIDSRGITDLQLRSSLGGFVDVGRPRPAWLPSARVTSYAGTVTSTDVEWRLASVIFHGTNIVQRGLQTFKPRDTPVIEVQVKLFTVEFRAVDAFFGSPKGSSIKLTMPDGTIRTVELRDGRATFEQLPSGDYDARVDARGLGTSQSVSVSGETPVELKVLSPLDLAIALGALSILVIGVVLLGLRTHRRRRATGVPSTPIDAPQP